MDFLDFFNFFRILGFSDFSQNCVKGYTPGQKKPGDMNVKLATVIATVYEQHMNLAFLMSMDKGQLCGLFGWLADFKVSGVIVYFYILECEIRISLSFC